jgi:hypothetical protein
VRRQTNGISAELFKLIKSLNFKERFGFFLFVFRVFFFLLHTIFFVSPESISLLHLLDHVHERCYFNHYFNTILPLFKSNSKMNDRKSHGGIVGK